MRNLRIEKNLSGDGLAALLPKRHHFSWISKIETNVMEPTVADLIALAQALDVTVGWLATGEATGDSEFIARMKGYEPQLDRRGRNLALTLVERYIEEGKDP